MSFFYIDRKKIIQGLFTNLKIQQFVLLNIIMSVLLKKDVPYAKMRKTNQPRRLQPTTFFFSGFGGCGGGRGYRRYFRSPLSEDLNYFYSQLV